MNYGKNAMQRRQQQLDAKSTKIRKKFVVAFWKVLLVCILVLGVTGISAGFGIIKGAIESAPDISEMDVIPTGYSTTVLASDGSEIATLVAEGSNRQYVTIDEIPKELQEAFVAIEDERFYEHNGIDLKSIARAFVAGVKNGFHFDQGGSTITMQLARNIYLDTGKNWQRKVKEMFIAIELEKIYSKNKIMECYLNEKFNNMQGKESAINYDYYHLKDKLELINLIEEYIQAIKTSRKNYSSAQIIKLIDRVAEQISIIREEKIDDEKIYLLIAICNVTKKAFKLLGVSNDMLINKIQKLTVS